MTPIPSSAHLIVSPRDFQWFVTLLTGGVAAYWIVVDSLRLRGALRDDASRPSVKDRIFGSIVGLTIGVIGIVGAYLGRP